MGAFLDFPSGVLNFDVLDLDVVVLSRHQRRFVRQLGVQTLQLLLLRAELRGRPLRLVQQVVSTRVGDDRVDIDTDGFRKLLQKVPMHLGETVKSGQLDHSERLALKKNRQHNQGGRWRLSQELDEIFR